MIRILEQRHPVGLAVGEETGCGAAERGRPRGARQGDRGWRAAEGGIDRIAFQLRMRHGVAEVVRVAKTNALRSPMRMPSPSPSAAPSW